MRRWTSIVGAILSFVLILVIGGLYAVAVSVYGGGLTASNVDWQRVPPDVSLALWYVESGLWMPAALVVLVPVLIACVQRARGRHTGILLPVCGVLTVLVAASFVTATAMLWHHGGIQTGRTTFTQFTIRDVLNALVVSAFFAAPIIWMGAATLVERLRTPDNPFLCRKCGYNLWGSRKAGRCPECGLPFGPPHTPA